MYSIGLDIGTTSVCGILCNAESGEIVSAISKDNDSFIITDNEWEKIQNPARLLEIAQEIADKLISIAKDERIASIGITGQMHGIVYLDNKGKPISNLTIWQDGRGDLAYKNGFTYAEWVTKKTGYRVATGYGAVTVFYDTINGLVPKNAVKFCTIHDLLALTLCNMVSPVTHISDAASFGLFNILTEDFDFDAIKELGIDYTLFPLVTKETKILGTTYYGIPVAVAIGDNQASFLGSVTDMDNSVLVNIGTGSQISVKTERPIIDAMLDCRPLIEGSYIIAGSSLCGGRAYAELERFFREVASIITGENVKSAYPAMDKLMAGSKPQISLKVDTRFSGTRDNPSRRGSISNIGINNLTMSNICDGVMNGIVKELYNMLKEFLPKINKRPTLLIGSGNGIRNNKPLCERFENAFKMSLVIPKNREEASFGSALFSLTAAGIYKDIESAQKLIIYKMEV